MQVRFCDRCKQNMDTAPPSDVVIDKVGIVERVELAIDTYLDHGVESQEPVDICWVCYRSFIEWREGR